MRVGISVSPSCNNCLVSQVVYSYPTHPRFPCYDPGLSTHPTPLEQILETPGLLEDAGPRSGTVRLDTPQNAYGMYDYCYC